MDTPQTILIIEDDDFLRSLAVTKLQKEGFNVTTAADGELGMTALQENKPDILLLDMMLPKVDGFEILANIQNDPNYASMKKIVFSNLGSEEDIRRGSELGAENFLIKSRSTLDELVQKIKDTLNT